MGSEITPTPAAPQFNWAAWIAGFFVAIVFGSIANFVIGFLALSFKSTVLAILTELVPGALIIAFSYKHRRQAFPQGAIVGAAIVAIIGGICGTTLGGGLQF